MSMVRSIWPAEPFNRAGAIFFAFVLMALGIATFTNVPLSFYGAFPLFRVLDTGRFVIDRGRLIDVPLQLPMPIALRFADSLAALRPSFCIAYATIPGVGLAVSLLVCKSRRPSLFIWPAMSICVVGLPGQCSLHSKAIMAVTLLWPALLAVLVDAPAKLWPLVAITSIATVCAHPNAAAVLASIVLVASFSARIRPQSRKRSLLFGSALGVLVVLRAVPWTSLWFRRSTFGCCSSWSSCGTSGVA